MKFAATLPFVAAAAAFVVPDVNIFQQIPIEGDHREGAPWWKKIPSKGSVVSAVKDAANSASSAIDHAIAAVEAKIQDGVKDLFEEQYEETLDMETADGPGRPHDFNLTIYQLISKSNHTTKFAKLVDEYDDIVKLLNSTKANYTLFVPIDKAFEHIPEDKKPSKKFVESVLQYHVGDGLYPARRIIHTHTLPTVLKEKLLGGKPQRLRTSVSFFGVRVNLRAKVIAANIGAKNGVIHAIDHILVPPPFVGRELSLLPSYFSTLLLAYEKTDFVDFIHNVQLSGSTVFAPTNQAFVKLGPRANAFLFNTELGKKYLRALLKYQIVANTTLYSDAIYNADAEQAVDIEEKASTSTEGFLIELPTLLGDKSILVSITKWAGFITMKVNGYAKVVFQDGIAKNGVIQVVDALPIPPRKPHKPGNEEVGEIEVEDLKERLAGYIEDVPESKSYWMSDL